MTLTDARRNAFREHGFFTLGRVSDQLCAACDSALVAIDRFLAAHALANRATR